MPWAVNRKSSLINTKSHIVRKSQQEILNKKKTAQENLLTLRFLQNKTCGSRKTVKRNQGISAHSLKHFICERSRTVRHITNTLQLLFISLVLATVQMWPYARSSTWNRAMLLLHQTCLSQREQQLLCSTHDREHYPAYPEGGQNVQGKGKTPRWGNRM